MQKPWPEAMRRDGRPLRERDMREVGSVSAKLPRRVRGWVEERAKTAFGAKGLKVLEIPPFGEKILALCNQA